MKLDRYKPNRRGIKEILGSEGVRADLTRRAVQVAEVAQAAYDARPPHQGTVEVIVDSQGDAERTVRARAAVIALHPAAQHIEADRRPLGAAIDAAG
jgi:hypothetical protein